MTNIEEQRAVILNLLAIGDNAASELLDKFESAIREQVVLEALPDELITDTCTTNHNSEYMGAYLRVHHDKIDGAKKLRSLAIERLVTREKVEAPFVELLMELAGIALPFMTTEQKQKLNSLTDGKWQEKVQA